MSMKQYTKEEIAACFKVVWLCNSAELGPSIWGGDIENVNVRNMLPLPNGNKSMYADELHNPEQYPWPEPGQCVEYSLEPSLEEDLRWLVVDLEDDLARLETAKGVAQVTASYLKNYVKATINDIQNIITKHYPES